VEKRRENFGKKRFENVVRRRRQTTRFQKDRREKEFFDW